MRGYLRKDGRKGIRNVVVVVYLVECARFVAQEIVNNFRGQEVHLIGFSGCYPNHYADKIMNQLVVHPNVGAVLLVSLGCESFNRNKLIATAQNSDRPVNLVGIQKEGGTRKSIDLGVKWVAETLPVIRAIEKVEMGIDELIIGTICGGSDATSGITANPAVGRSFDKLVELGATVIFEETGEMIGLEQHLKSRTKSAELAEELENSIKKAAIYYSKMGHGSFAPGNADGGLSTLEEKSLGAYTKSGTSEIKGIIDPGEVPAGKGLYLLDVVPEGDPLFGFPNISDNAEIGELMACGCHIILFTTGRGSVVGSAILPIIKVCANPETYERMKDDMDINAGKIMNGEANLEEVGQEIVDKIESVASGNPSCSEALGHQEFILTYKQMKIAEPHCLTH